MNSYELKQEERRQRYEDRAAKAKGESDQRFKVAKNISSMIPMGQPILVGHHSEAHHRADIKRIDNNMRKGVEADKKAQYYADKADSVGSGGISSDDPDAVTKLTEKVEELEARQELMKKVNRVHRLFVKDPESAATVKALDELPEVLAARVRGYVPEFSFDRGPFPPYSLQNNNANIRRIRERIERLQREETKQEAAPIEGNGYTIIEDKDDNRIHVMFPGKPSEAIRSILKRNGFKWSPTRTAWVRMLNNSGRYAAQCVAEKLGAMEVGVSA